MTLPRTRHRREARKRAKKRRGEPRGRGFIVPSWLVTEVLHEFSQRGDILMSVLKKSDKW